MSLEQMGSGEDPVSGNGHGRISAVSRTGIQNIDGLLDGYKWTSDSITVSFPGVASAYGTGYQEALHGFSSVTGQMKVAAAAAFTQVMAVTGLRITETGNSATANIRLAHSSDASPTAYAYTPGDYYKAGDVWFSGTQYNAPVRGDYAWTTMLHELGHALGLKHPHETTSEFPVTMQSAYDSMEYSVMSYRSYIGASVQGSYTNENFGFAQTFMMYDIAALQKLYGADYTTNSGDDVYSFSPTTGTMFIDGVSQGTPGANRIFLTIWDGGGNDTYDFSNYATDLIIDLRAGGYSKLAAAQIAGLGDGRVARGNVFNALLYNNDPRSLIENARGGVGNDVIVGNQGDNRLEGGAGDDRIDGGTGNDTLNGGAGVDTAVIHARLTQTQVTFSPGGALLDGPQGDDTLFAIEHYTFNDGTVVQYDGNSEVDDLYYFAKNPDVWNAHLDAELHFGRYGWKEGRNPNALFDTKYYLAHNPDVAAARMNPLDHYHLYGWKEGRDPSPNFDTSAYLAINPDVAAANMDPLEHYLSYGMYQGRSTRIFDTASNLRAVTLTFTETGVTLKDSTGTHDVSGLEQLKFRDGLIDQRDNNYEIDDLYYASRNPDVWAARLDPDTHYSLFGWKEGRNPNAYFDTKGYLAHNPDVAAARMDPLLHYHLYGWKEGRDPSAQFDTKAYLEANPDVAAANMDPLQHFLQYGLTQGREAIADHLW